MAWLDLRVRQRGRCRCAGALGGKGPPLTMARPGQVWVEPDGFGHGSRPRDAPVPREAHRRRHLAPTRDCGHMGV